MKSIKNILIACLYFSCTISFAQRGKDGNVTINTLSRIVNEYTNLTADAPAGTTSLSVAASGLNTNNRFSGPLAVGDLVMIYQMEGATILGQPDAGVPTIGNPNDATWGGVTNYNNCGNYEYAEVSSVPNSNTIVLDCGLTKNYTASGRVQVIRVPRYNTLTITAPGILTCQVWNGTIGGVLAVEVLGNTIVNSGAKINVTGTGFRGGALFTTTGRTTTTIYSCVSLDVGTNKGEGIAGYDTDYTPYGGKYCRAAAANAGGGGNVWNCGGGGGANAGNTASWTGQGNPNTSGAGWSTAWNLESAGFATSTSSGGGRGGYSFSSSNQNATVLGPGTPGNTNAWSGAYRYNLGGLGGRPLDYSTGKIFLGGGGGAGEQDNNQGGAGGKGGGLVYFVTYGNFTGSGNDSIIADGAVGGSTLISGSNSGKDAAGGGGGGGTIIINATGTISGIALRANGGTGGHQLQNTSGFFPLTEAEGPGGGGGGGYIAVSSGTPAQQAIGGDNGITQSPHLTEFPPNGATKGGTGLTNQAITNFTITAADVSICSGNTANLTASLSGTVPAGTNIDWYSAQTGGSPIATGTSYTTPVLTGTTTYYVGTCPGTYRIPVTVTITPLPSVSVNSFSICAGQTANLVALGATTYTWSAGATSTGTNTADANPSSTATYTVTGTTSGCSATAVSTITVTPSPTITVNSASICSGETALLTANGGTSYTWSLGASPVGTNTAEASPVITTTYTVTGTTNGCSGSATSVVNVTASPSVSVNSLSLCIGQTGTLTANGAASYTWSAGATPTGPSTADVSPSAPTSYTVTGTSSGCTDTAIAQVNVNPVPAITVSSATICTGQTAFLLASGGTSYTWSAGATPTGTASAEATPVSSATYTVTGTENGCSNTAVATVTVVSSFTLTVTSPTICAGDVASLTANGGNVYTWSSGATSTGGNTAVASPTSTTSYTVSSTSGSCSGSAVSTVTVISAPNVTVNSPAICPGQTASLIANGATTYVWSAGATSTGANTADAAPAATTSYTVTGTTGSCSATAVSTVTVGNGLVINVDSPIICPGNPANMTATGATTYTWSTGATSTGTNTAVASPTATTSYTVTGSTPTCSGTAVSTVTVLAAPTITVNSPHICYGQTANLTATGADTFTWPPGATSSGVNTATASPITTTTYTVSGSSGGCPGTATATVFVDPLPVITVNSPTICAGQTATLVAGGAISYTWSSGATPSPTNSDTAFAQATSSFFTYTVSGSDGTCIGTNSISVNVIQPISINVNSPAICFGQSATLTATGASGYSWSTGATGSSITESPGTTTSYTVTETTSGCSGNTISTITVNPIPVVSLNSSTPSICIGQTATLTANGATTYTWSAGATPTSTNTADVTPVIATTYTVTGTSIGCSASATSTIQVNNLPSPGFTADKYIGCSPLTVNFNETTSASCNLLTYDFGDGTTSSTSGPSHIYSQPGNYSVSISCTDVNGCTGASSASMITIASDPVSDFSVSPSSGIKPNTPVVVTDLSTGGGYQTWIFDDAASGENDTSYLFTDSHIYASDGTYCIRLISSNSYGCTDTSRQCIDVISESMFSIPNIFTPNGDGVNDLFFIKSVSIKNITCAIYDRWGLKLAEWDGVNGFWDGKTSSGSAAPDGVYYYMATIEKDNNEIIQKQGFVQLLQNK
jgi:gliding motility-associated-like protein